MSRLAELDAPMMARLDARPRRRTRCCATWPRSTPRPAKATVGLVAARAVAPVRQHQPDRQRGAVRDQPLRREPAGGAGPRRGPAGDRRRRVRRSAPRVRVPGGEDLARWSLVVGRWCRCRTCIDAGASIALTTTNYQPPATKRRRRARRRSPSAYDCAACVQPRRSLWHNPDSASPRRSSRWPISLGFISLFDFPSFAGNVTFFTLCLIPMQVMAVVLWGANPPFVAKMGQPAKGLCAAGAHDRRRRDRVPAGAGARPARAISPPGRFPRTSRSSRCRRRSTCASSSAGGRSRPCSRTRSSRASSRWSPPTW